MALVLAALANPSLVQEEREKVRDIVAVVIDRSGSQALGDRAEMTTRVREELERRLGAMPDVETRFVEAGDGEGEDGTRLFAALGRALADVPPDRLAGVLMVTDGVVHDIPADSGELGFKAPVHALITGRPNERDRRIALIEAPRFGIVGKEQTIRAEVSERGGTGTARVTVRRDGQPVLSEDVRTGAPFNLTVRVEHGGPNVVEIEADQLPGELTPANNRSVVTIEGIREKLRVLLVSRRAASGRADLAQPPEIRRQSRPRPLHHPEAAREAGRHPDQRTVPDRLPDPRACSSRRSRNSTSSSSTATRTRASCRRTYFDNIARYVREGGALLIAAGPEFSGPSSLARTRLAAILPGGPDGRILEEPFKAKITREGQRHPVARDLPGSESDPPAWGEWLRTIGADIRSGTSVMSGAGDRPLLVLSREEKGRVALLLSDHAWLWAPRLQRRRAPCRPPAPARAFG